MTYLQHAARISLANKLTTFSLDADALRVDDGAAPQSIAYGAIKKLQLISYAGAAGRQGQLTIYAAGHGKVKTRSHHYVSLANFENRSSSYAPFVRELCRRVAAANPNAVFQRGSAGLWFVWLVVLALIGIVLLLLVVSLFDGSISAKALGGIFGLSIILPIAWRSVRGNKALAFNPDDPPADLLQF